MNGRTIIQNLNQIARYDNFALPTGAGEQKVPLLKEKPTLGTSTGQTIRTNQGEDNTFGSTKAVQIHKLDLKFIPATIPLVSEVISPALLLVIAEIMRTGELLIGVNNQDRLSVPLQRFFVQPLEAVTTGWDGLPFSLAGSLLLNVPIDFLGYSFNMNLTYQTESGAEGLGMSFIAEGYELLNEEATRQAFSNRYIDLSAMGA